MNLDLAVAAAKQNYADARPNSAAWARRAAEVLPGGNTRSVLAFEPFPFRVERAEGKYLWDVDGHQYVDFLGNYTAGLLGHSPEPVEKAVRAVLDSGWSLGSVHRDEVQLAELLTDRFPSIEQVRFTNSGTEANLMALALATHTTGRSKVVVFQHGYHGGVLAFGETANPVNVPHHWLVLPYNDETAVVEAFRAHGADIACVLVEPMQGSAGCIPGTPEFLSLLRNQCSSSGSLLIFDEVMTSRFSLGGAQEVLEIAPDLTTLGKYLAGGFSFGAFGGSRKIMGTFDPKRSGGPVASLAHAGTFNNNVISMAAGVATLREMVNPAVLDRTNKLGESLRKDLNEIFLQAGVGMCATGQGSLMNIHGTAGPVRSAADLAGGDDRLKELLFFALLDHGFYIARRGFIALSFEITAADVANLLTSIKEWSTAHRAPV
ncbi:MAG: aminotransferase class III-fold pyridoxal phosphate-dependent enzyme [Acidimicrobiales bacterium]|nr:aminotransferase class III-fold pyridoxal phosphate-dependent enzyme [Acidimicrobiales bacterium]